MTTTTKQVYECQFCDFTGGAIEAVRHRGERQHLIRIKQSAADDFCDDCHGYTHMPWCPAYEAQPTSAVENKCKSEHPWQNCPKCGVGICGDHMTAWLNHKPHHEQPASATGSELWPFCAKGEHEHCAGEAQLTRKGPPSRCGCTCHEQRPASEAQGTTERKPADTPSECFDRGYLGGTLQGHSDGYEQGYKDATTHHEQGLKLLGDLLDKQADQLSRMTTERDGLREVNKQLVEALKDLIRQLPNNERLADFNLDQAEAAIEANAALNHAEQGEGS